MGQQPSIPTDLSKELRVIGAGFSRTGTVSFALALEKLLQGPVCHGGTTLFGREEGLAPTPFYCIFFSTTSPVLTRDQHTFANGLKSRAQKPAQKM
jgi:hypothetical protein